MISFFTKGKIKFPILKVKNPQNRPNGPRKWAKIPYFNEKNAKIGQMGRENRKIPKIGQMGRRTSSSGPPPFVQLCAFVLHVQRLEVSRLVFESYG